MSKKKTWMVILLIVVVAVLTIGVPFAINEAYKVDKGYVTMWGAEDVLSYYGAILGATATVAALAFTIWFTKRQIQRDAYLKNETDKWRQVEFTIGNILNEINPMPILKQDMGIDPNDPDKAINLFQEYQLNCQIATDQLMTCINTKDYKIISKLVKRITKVADKLSQASEKKIKQHMQQRKLELRDSVSKLLSIADKCPNAISKKDVAEYQRIMEEPDSFNLDDILNSMKPIIEEFFHIYKTEFRPLLKLKGTTFESIYMQIQKNANSILSSGRK